MPRWILRLGASLLRITVALVLCVVVLGMFVPPIRMGADVVVAGATANHLIGLRGVVPLPERLMLNWYLRQMRKETGIDIRILFTRLAPGASVDRYAADAASARGVGRRDGLRGVLVVYDATSSDMRVELGYGLESWFTDAFIGRLVEDHAAAYFRAGYEGLGLRLLSRILHERIRDEMIGGSFRPEALDRSASAHVSGGAGAAGRATRADEGIEALHASARAPESATSAAQFTPQPTVEGAYNLFLEWLRPEGRSADATLLTRQSRFYVETLPLSGPYFDHIREVAWNEPFRIVQRGDYAILYYTGTPLRSPMYFRLGDNGWQVDFVEEVCNSLETIRRPYTWTLRPGCASTDRFIDLYATIDGFVRVRDGDNRKLPAPSRR